MGRVRTGSEGVKVDKAMQRDRTSEGAHRFPVSPKPESGRPPAPTSHFGGEWRGGETGARRQLTGWQPARRRSRSKEEEEDLKGGGRERRKQRRPRRRSTGVPSRGLRPPGPQLP